VLVTYRVYCHIQTNAGQKRNRWDATAPTDATPKPPRGEWDTDMTPARPTSEWDIEETPAPQAGRWDATPGAATTTKAKRWDATPSAAEATPVNAWDATPKQVGADATPVMQTPSGAGGTFRLLFPLGRL